MLFQRSQLRDLYLQVHVLRACPRIIHAWTFALDAQLLLREVPA